MQVALVGLVGENQTAINCQGVHTPQRIPSNYLQRWRRQGLSWVPPPLPVTGCLLSTPLRLSPAPSPLPRGYLPHPLSDLALSWGGMGCLLSLPCRHESPRRRPNRIGSP